MSFDALEETIRADEFDERKLAMSVVIFIVMAGRATVLGVELLLADGMAEDVIVDGVSEVADLTVHPARPPPKRHVEAKRALGIEVGVPHLECEITGMRSEEVELLQRGVSGGARQADRQREPILRHVGPEQEPDRSRNVGEVTGTQPLFRIEG